MQAIDMHGHVVPETILHQLENDRSRFPSVAFRRLEDGRALFSFNGTEQPEPLWPELLDVPGLVSWMDEARIDVQIEGIWSGLFGYMLAPDEASDWSRFLNEEMLRVVRANDRLLALATVPIQDGRRAVSELEAARKMGYPGVTIGTQAPGRELDDPDLDTFWEAAASLDMPVFIHPMHLTEPRLQAYGLPPIVGRTADTTIAVSRLLCAGVPQRHPGLTLILSHGGGTLPYLVGRLERHYEITPGIADPVEGFHHLYFDSCVYRPEILRFLVEMCGAEKVMVGTDAPFAIAPARPRDFVERSGLDDTAVRAILVDNARRVFGI
jgi:aminocarboxymuconate-semialdehyde decarboxylase